MNREQEKIIRSLVKEAIEEDEQLNEFIKQISNAVSQGVDRMKGAAQNVSASIQGAKAGLTGNVQGVQAANQQKAQVAVNFMKNQGARIEKDAANYFNQLNQRAQSAAQSPGGHAPGDQNADTKNHDYMLARALKGFANAAKQANTESPAVNKTVQTINTSVTQPINTVEKPAANKQPATNKPKQNQQKKQNQQQNQNQQQGQQQNQPSNDNAKQVAAENRLLNNKNLTINEIVDLVNYLYK